MAEPGGRLLEVVFVECGAAFGDVQVRVLGAIGGRDKLAAFLEFSCGVIGAPRTRQGQTQLVVAFPALRLQPRGLLQCRDRLSRLSHPAAALYQAPGGPVRTSERGR